ncbi:hypothetical protein QR685DRAFT_574973 [Neurospora intermedia]|uniref:Uncharacterized protein n=1 Tax=Neurospora intermedia TaxID=5142 RepID=A0ABR3D2J6_NEUIN
MRLRCHDRSLDSATATATATDGQGQGRKPTLPLDLWSRQGSLAGHKSVSGAIPLVFRFRASKQYKSVAVVTESLTPS